MKKAILEALEAKYNAQIAEADATIKIYLENSVGIGEHPQHIDEVDKQLQRIADADEKLKALEDRYNAQISEADATLKIYLEHSVGIGEHPQHIDEVDKLIDKIAQAEEKLDVLDEFEPEKGTTL